MAAQKSKKRETEVTRAIHRLFWQAKRVKLRPLLIGYLARIAAELLYNVFIPIQIAYGVQAIFTKQFDTVSGYAISLLVLAIGYGILWIIGGLATVRNGAAGASYVQRAAFSNYLQKDYDFFNNTYFGSLGEQVSHLRGAFISYSQLVTLYIPRQIVIVGAGIIVIGYQSISLAIVTLVTMSAILGFTLWSGRWRLKYRRRLSQVNSELAGVTGDALSHGPTVKSFAAEAYEINRLDAAVVRWARVQLTSWSTALPGDAGRALLAAIAIAVLLLTTARLYQAGSVSIAVVALVQLYVIKMIAATQDIAEIIKTYEQAIGSAYQPVKTMLIESTVVDQRSTEKLSTTAKHPITFSNVTFSYNDSKKSVRAVKNFSLTIKPGEKIGLVGYSGSGKTTLTKLLLRFMDVNEGAITIGRHDIRHVAQFNLRKAIAYVPQEPLLFHRSVFENIAYGKPRATKKEILAAARMAYVDEFVDELPEGYDSVVGERGIKLSGGQRQRVAIARAILKDAPVLVLDEATSALDSRSEQLIQKALWRLMKDRTTLVIAHRLSTIHRMDRIVVMDKGKIVQAGTHAELLEDKKGIYAELWAHQSGGYIGIAEEGPEEPVN